MTVQTAKGRDGAALDTLSPRQLARLSRRVARGQLEPILHAADVAVLRRDVTLPAVAERRLQDVLGFEVASLTPFERNALFWSWAIKSRDRREKTLRVEVNIVPEAAVQDAITAARGAGIELDALADPTAPDVPLYRNGARRAKATRGFGAVLMKVGVVACLASATVLLVQTEIRLRGHAEQAEARLAALRTDALSRSDQSAPEEHTAAAQAAFTAQTTRPPVLEILAALTATLPDSASVDRVELTRDQLEISGHAEDAVSLVAIVDASPLFGTPEFLAPVRRDADAGKDRFAMKIGVNGESGPSEDATGE
ncbi:MAG: PilN domain-containing protein [Pseudomonadota bacterium]